MRIQSFVVGSALVSTLSACGALLGAAEEEPLPSRPSGDAADATSEAIATDDADAGADDASDGASDGASDDVSADAATTDGDAGRVERYVFVTSTKYAGNFGSRADADAECTLLAKAADPSKFGASKFRAFLATGGGASPSSHVVDHAYHAMDGKLLFANAAATLGTPANGAIVAIDEKGVNHSGAGVSDRWVWTGLAAGLAANERTCGDWTIANGAFGGFGDLTQNATWAQNGESTAACTTPYRLYCFEE